MGRPKLTHKHLPEHVVVIRDSYYWRPPEGRAERIGPVGDETAIWKFLLSKGMSVQNPPKPGSTLNAYFERYEREVVPTLAPRTQSDYRRHLVILRKVFGHMQPNDVLPKHIGAFLDRPKGRIQANRQVAVLSAVFTKMVGRWYVADRNPCTGVERNPSHRRTRYITDAEFSAVYASCSPRLRLAMDLALLTGQRQGDLLALPWKNVTDEGILFRQGKTGKRLLVVMSSELREVLNRAREMAPVVDIGGYVIRTRRGLPYTSEGFRAMWQRMVKRALKRELIAERFTFHDLRAKSVSDSKSLQEAMERAGHTSMAMTRGTYDRGVRKVTPLR